MQHMYRTAEYIGNKIYTITEDPNDAFWLAQVYYNNNEFIRAIDLLTKDNLESLNIICRYLMGLCLFKLQRYDDALDVVDELNPFSDSKQDSDPTIAPDGGIKVESSLCYLRGLIFAAQNNLKKAKTAFKEAVLVDVKNYEAFESLISKNLISPEEEWDLLLSLDFSTLGDNEEMIRYLYTLNVSKYIHQDVSKTAKQSLSDEYGLSNNIDILRYQIETLYSQCKFSECLEACEKALDGDEYNPTILPTYISLSLIHI